MALLIDLDTMAKLGELGWHPLADSVDLKRGTKREWQETLCREGILYYNYSTGEFLPSPFA